MRDIRLVDTDIQAQNFAWFAFGGDLKRAATHFAVSRESLRWDGGVNQDLETLATVGALDGFRNLQVAQFMLCGEMIQASKNEHEIALFWYGRKGNILTILER